MGFKIDQFDVPVCNSFQPKILNDQLCYEVDLNSLSNKANIQRELKSGLNFLMDYNEDRQVIFDDDNSPSENEDVSLTRNIVESNQDQQAFIYLNTVGKNTVVSGNG